MPACTVPGMVPAFWPMVVLPESSRNPWALHDDTAGRAYYPNSAAAAEMIARRLMGAGHSVGVGLSQLTARSEQLFRDRFGLTVREALEPCPNMRAGARHYVLGALSIYNTGHLARGIQNGYAASVLALTPSDFPAPMSAQQEEAVIEDRPAEPSGDINFGE